MLIAKAVSGSRLHGTYSEESDYDYRGVFFAPVNQILGSYKRIPFVKEAEHDTVLWELQFFMQMCSQNTSNAMDVLYTPDNFLVHSTPFWDMVQRSKGVFVSQRYILETLRHKRAAVRELKRYESLILTDAHRRERIFKNCSHVIRLLVQCKTLIETGGYNPSFSTYIQTIKNVKNSRCTVAEVRNLLEEFDLILPNYKSLPREVNLAEVNKLTEILTRRYINDFSSYPDLQ